MIHPARIKKQRLIVVISFLLIVTTMMIGTSIGSSSLTADRLIQTILGHGSMKEEFILYAIRLPRMLITLLAGMALALSGSILQSITKNDLADPGIIGINSGAGVAVAVFFLFFPIEAGSFVYMIPIIGFLGAIVTGFFIYLFAYSKKDGLQPVNLVLIGVGFSTALSGAMIVIISSAEREKVDFIAKWLAGNIWGTDWPFVLALLPWLIILIPFALFKAHRLNLLGLSDSVAMGVGVSIDRERIILLLTAIALAAAAVSVTGGISFIGLMAPHIAKTLVGPRNQLFIPVAILLGGWLLLAADTIGRHLIHTPVPAGIMVAIIGAPYFVYLLMREER